MPSSTSPIHISVDEDDELIVEAHEDIKKNELIICSLPMIIATEPKKLNSVCNYCYRDFDKLLRCSKCKLVRYCSKECQKADWKFHREECPYFVHLSKIEEDQNVGNLQLEMLMIRLLITLSSNVSLDYTSLADESNIDYVFKNKKDYLHSTLKRNYNPRADILYNADTVSSYIRFIEQSIPENSLTIDLSIIRNCFYFLKQNLINVTRKCVTIAKAIFFPLPFMLTNTRSNTYYTFHNNMLYLYASTDIKKGEMISFSYIPYNLPFYYKQELYQSRCLNLDVSQYKDELNLLMDMRCPNGHEQSIPNDLLQQMRLHEFKCTICNQPIHIPFLLEKDQTYFYDTGYDIYTYYKSMHIPVTEIVNLFESKYGPNNYLLQLFYYYIRDDLLNDENYEQALPFCRQIVQYNRAFLPDQPEKLIGDMRVLLMTLNQLYLWNDMISYQEEVEALKRLYCHFEEELSEIEKLLNEARESVRVFSWFV